MNLKKLSLFLNTIVLIVAAASITVFIISAFSTDFLSVNWVVFAISLTAGLAAVTKGILAKSMQTRVIGRRVSVFGGAGLIVIAFLCLVWEFALSGNQILGIVSLIVVLALLVITLLVSGGPKWNVGDNRQDDYKDYHQRKAEEELKAEEFNQNEGSNSNTNSDN